MVVSIVAQDLERVSQFVRDRHYEVDRLAVDVSAMQRYRRLGVADIVCSKHLLIR